MTGEFRMIQRAHLLPPANPMRVNMGDEPFAQLVISIAELGVLQALLVFPQGDKWEIRDGHRRYLASEKLGLEFLPCRVYDSAEECSYRMMLDATACHEDFTAAEEGQQFIELAEKHGWGIAELCKQFARSESYINARVELAAKDPLIRDAVNERKINMAQAHELLREKDVERRRVRLLLCLEHGYNARELRVMRQNLESERVVNAGGVMPHTPQWATPPPADEPKICEWCGDGEDQDNLQPLYVHRYHRRETLATLKQYGLRTLLALSGARGDPATGEHSAPEASQRQGTAPRRDPEEDGYIREGEDFRPGPRHLPRSE